MLIATRALQKGCNPQIPLLPSALFNTFNALTFLTIAEVTIPMKDLNLLLAPYR